MEIQDSNSVADALEKSAIIEAMIFSANEPVEAKKIVQVYNEVVGDSDITVADVYTIVASINERYVETSRPLQIFEWGGGFRIATKPEFAPYIKALHQIGSSRRLSRSLTETLAIIAYKQPVTKPEIDFVRGVDSDYALRRLMELDLVDVLGRSESVGKPLLYGTTAEFLEKFGLNSTTDLPNIREIEDLIDDPAFNRERAELFMSKGLSLIMDDADSSAEPVDAESAAQERVNDLPVAEDTTAEQLSDEPEQGREVQTQNGTHQG